MADETHAAERPHPDPLRLGAFAHLGLDAHAGAGRDAAHGIALRALPVPALVDLRLDPNERAAVEGVGRALALALPPPGASAAAPGTLAYRLGPDEWWLRSDGLAAELAAKLRAALGETHAAVTEIGEGWAQIEVAGPQARALLAKGCPLDFHPRAFPPGAVRQSLLSKADAVYRLVSAEAEAEAEGETATGTAAAGPVFEVTLRRSFADYGWRWLYDAAREYGVSVLE